MAIPDPRLTRGRAFYLGIVQAPAGARTIQIPIPEFWDYWDFHGFPNWNTVLIEYQSTLTEVTVEFQTPVPPGGGQLRYSFLH